MAQDSTMSPVLRVVLGAVVMAVAIASARPPEASAGSAADSSAGPLDPVVYLTWHQPYGMPGATENLTPSRAPDQRDTLWLVFEPRRTSKLFGVSVQLEFLAPPSDTLSDHWRFGGGTANPRNIVVEFPLPSWPVHGPWTIPGFGGAHYERESGKGKLDIIYAVNADSAGPVEAPARYALARILFPSMSAAEAARPVCIEWVSSEISFAIGAPDAHPGPGGSPFASVGSPGCVVCRTYRAARRLPPFKPKAPSPDPSTRGH